MERTSRTIVRTVVVAVILSISPICVRGQSAEPAAELALKQVALFKNGLGFFTGQALCPENTTAFELRPTAASSHGTFWVAYPPKLAIKAIVAREVETHETMEATTIAELLKANVGRQAKLSVRDETITGVIKHFTEPRPIPKADPYAPGAREDEMERRYAWDRAQGQLVAFETDDGELYLDPRTVTQVELLGNRAERTFAQKRETMELEVRLNRPAKGAVLTISYLAKGATWAPSYMVDISRKDKAQISAKAVIVNEACELDGVEVQLVTGFPHLQFADVVNPMAMKENLAQFLQALSKGESERGQPGGVMFNVMAQSASSYRAPGGSGGAMPAYGTAETGTIAEDLFLYPAGSLTLAKGEVGYLPLFSETAPYEHIYQWDIPDYVDEEGRYQYGRDNRNQQEPEQEVWHSLRLTNATRVPWTTAPAETVKDGMILGQDTLQYTPAGSDGILRITRAVGVKAEQIELETDRQREAARLYGYSYDLITVRGELSVANTQDKPITLEITKTLSGAVKSADPQAKREKLAKGLRRMNGLMKLIWTINLPPGKDQDISYTYEVYVRR